MLDVKNLGQVFTPQNIVADMLNLVKNDGRFLEPSAGNGAFYENLPENKVGIELDKNVIKNPEILNIDFFAYDLSQKFDTIIGNPPYVRYQDISYETKFLLSPFMQNFDERSNLYLFFIYKAILHLNDGGELIFITPRDFLKSTSSVWLNNFIFLQGTITDFIDLGDRKIFENAQPNCAIWRFEKANFSRQTRCYREFSCVNGVIFFSKNHYSVPFNELFFVKVGAVSGDDKIFANDKFGNMEFVGSQTAKTGKTKRMIYGEYGKECAYLLNFKERLISRKIRKFDEQNWWQWGRDYFKSELPRIYVNTKTRNKRPFFTHSCTAYDGSVLAIFPKFKCDLNELKMICEMLNDIDWNELGFVCDGRFLFSQRSLENAMLDDRFMKFYKKD
ncbi:hypothetical protein LMG7974_00765 [Campylobacter majalis]|uniref:site-specific DNA-methyltransferase (adenine-specific) n=2 Tax=Campylobacter majalis TaxID=2790656 RepID=A0ABM8Q4U1_9BACT|nr:hypothetical protein LMG7974_00765 [Campylobacter majalis]